MASGFANRDTNWYIRVSGDELNGGGFDPFQSGAGTNYADQNSAQWSSTTGTSVLGTPTKLTDTSMTFTSDIVGNVLRASARTGGSAIALDYFVVTGFIDSHNITLDRAICASADITALTYRIGGAHAHIYQYTTVAYAGTSPILDTPLIGGNNIYIRGDGSDDPGSNTYDWSGGKWEFPAGGNLVTGNIRIIGYNGRPRIAHQGVLIYFGTYEAVENISFYQSVAGSVDYGPWGGGTSTTSFYNCIFDQAGVDGRCVKFGNGTDGSGHLLACEIRNTGSTSAGTIASIYAGHAGTLIFGCWIHGVRNVGIENAGTVATVQNTLIQACGSHGMDCTEADSSAPVPGYCMNNTFYANLGHGINLAANAQSDNSIFNNIFKNHTGSGKFAINFADSLAVNTQKYKMLIGFNDYHGNTNNFNGSPAVWSLNPTSDGPLVGDLTVDPSFVNAGGNDFSPGVSVSAAGLALAPNLVTPAVLPMGAIRL